jgi:hypothetical protein
MLPQRCRKIYATVHKTLINLINIIKELYGFLTAYTTHTVVGYLQLTGCYDAFHKDILSSVRVTPVHTATATAYCRSWTTQDRSVSRREHVFVVYASLIGDKACFARLLCTAII